MIYETAIFQLLRQGKLSKNFQRSTVLYSVIIEWLLTKPRVGMSEPICYKGCEVKVHYEFGQIKKCAESA